MSKTGFLRSLTAATLAAAIFAASSLTTLAAPGKTIMGELTVNGADVTVNGETANTGRTIFSSNTIATPANSGAIVNLGALGQIELAPNSSINLTFDENGISGTLTSGQVKLPVRQTSPRTLTRKPVRSRRKPTKPKPLPLILTEPKPKPRANSAQSL